MARTGSRCGTASDLGALDCRIARLPRLTRRRVAEQRQPRGVRTLVRCDRDCTRALGGRKRRNRHRPMRCSSRNLSFGSVRQRQRSVVTPALSGRSASRCSTSRGCHLGRHDVEGRGVPDRPPCQESADASPPEASCDRNEGSETSAATYLFSNRAQGCVGLQRRAGGDVSSGWRTARGRVPRWHRRIRFLIGTPDGSARSGPAWCLSTSDLSHRRGAHPARWDASCVEVSQTRVHPAWILEVRMAQRKTLSERQLVVLRWIAEGCPDGVMVDDHHRISAGALRNRGLVTTSGRGPSWSAHISDAGRDYLQRADGPNPPIPREPNLSVTQQLVVDVIAAGGSLRFPRRGGVRMRWTTNSARGWRSFTARCLKGSGCRSR